MEIKSTYVEGLKSAIAIKAPTTMTKELWVYKLKSVHRVQRSSQFSVSLLIHTQLFLVSILSQMYHEGGGKKGYRISSECKQAWGKRKTEYKNDIALTLIHSSHNYEPLTLECLQKCKHGTTMGITNMVSAWFSPHSCLNVSGKIKYKHRNSHSVKTGRSEPIHHLGNLCLMTHALIIPRVAW